MTDRVTDPQPTDLQRAEWRLEGAMDALTRAEAYARYARYATSRLQTAREIMRLQEAALEQERKESTAAQAALQK